MTLEELEEKLRNEKLLRVYDRGAWKEYKTLIRQQPFGIPNIYGIMEYEQGGFAVYITWDERGGESYYWATFDTIEEACDKLYWKVNLLDTIYKEHNPDYKGENG